MIRLALIPAALGLALAAPAEANTLAFTGTFNNTNPPAASGGRCANLTVTIGNFGPFTATGVSNLGAFTSSQSHCLNAGPPIAVGAPDTPYYDGRFTYSFATGDTLSGTYDGVLSNGGAMGVVDNVQTFTVTGGGGLFANASGSFVGNGQLKFGAGPPAATLTISNGVINLSAVPEPATWSTLIAGFALAGGALRRRRTGVAA